MKRFRPGKPHVLELESVKSMLIEFFQTKEIVEAAYLFGSYAEGTNTPFSDLDLAVLFAREAVFDQIGFEVELVKLLRTEEIDIVNLDLAPLRMQFRIIKKGDLIYCSNRARVADFCEFVAKRYGDFRTDLEQIYRDYDEGLREEFMANG